MTAATASDQPVDAAGDQTAPRLWRERSAFLFYVFTGGLYGIWWFWVTRHEMAEEMGKKPNPGVIVLEAIGQLVLFVNAFVWYRTINDINTLREKVGAPKVNLWGWVAALALALPLIYIFPVILAPALDAFNADAKQIVKAAGYAAVPATLLVFGYMVGYWNEYWLEKTDEQATTRPVGPLDGLFFILSVVVVVGIAAGAGAF